MKALKLIGMLLDYPADTLWADRDELLSACDAVGLSSRQADSLRAFADSLLAMEPMDAQERWLALFDRGRSMSLMLFEHIYGESRDRGQAMVDLVETYRRSGLDLDACELPDYLPLVLEFLSMQPEAEVRDWLGHIAHILQLIAARAEERESPYAVLLQLVLELGTGSSDTSLMRRRVVDEERDDTPEAMDQVWEEEAVRFGPEAPGEGCEPHGRLPAGTKTKAQKYTETRA